jgi:thiol-disulfide isomerase/thioredoxin
MRWLCVLSLLACGRPAPPQEPRPSQEPPLATVTTEAAKPAKPAGCAERCLPEVALVDVRGTRHDRASLAGKVVVINFFATWTGPSKKELPVLAKVSSQYGAQASFIGVLISDDGIEAAELDAFLAKYGVSYPVVRATREIQQAFNYPSALPHTFVYDRDGNLAGDHVGALDESKLTKILEPLQ